MTERDKRQARLEGRIINLHNRAPAVPVDRDTFVLNRLFFQL